MARDGGSVKSNSNDAVNSKPLFKSNQISTLPLSKEQHIMAQTVFS
jgi:hypothetical protein